jgi:hypothetical protein
MIVMLATRCACGFECLADEEVIDHLLAVFEPEDAAGNDGRSHEEMAFNACSCGFQAASGDELDIHFLLVFTPADLVGDDGEQHEATNPSRWE